MTNPDVTQSPGHWQTDWYDAAGNYLSSSPGIAHVDGPPDAAYVRHTVIVGDER